MSARSAIALPPGRDPVSVPITPVRAMPRSTSIPNESSSCATISAVRCSSKAVSGWACRSCRQAVISAVEPAIRLMTGIGRSLYPSDDPALAQARDVAVVIAECAQNFVAVLAGLRAGALQPARRAAQRHRLSNETEPAEGRVLDRRCDAEMPDLRIGEDLIHLIDRPGRHAGLVKSLDPFGAVARLGDCLDRGVERLAIVGAQLAGPVIRMIREVRDVQRPAQTAENLVAGRCDI